MRRPSELAIFLSGRHVADLERTPTGIGLAYRDDVALDATPLSLSLPPGRREFHGAAVSDWLWGLLPESAAARDAVERIHGADPHDPLSLLAAIGLDCAGAVQFCLPSNRDAVLTREGQLERASDSAIESRLADLELTDERSWSMPDEHWSLGGTHGKFTLRRQHGRWHYPHGSEPSTHIVKPGVRGLEAQALVEHVSTAAAAALGLDVVATEYADFHSQRAIVIERFDRVTTDAVRRLHAEDLCQATGTREKYEDRGGPSARHIVRFLREHSSTRAEERRNIDSFVGMLVFNTLIGAPDGHARNYSVMLDGEHVRLAPGYDIASGLAYERSAARPREVAMSIGGQTALGSIDSAAFSRTAAELDIDAEGLLGLVRTLAREIPAAFEAALAGIDDWDGVVTTLRERLLPALSENCSRFVS